MPKPPLTLQVAADPSRSTSKMSEAMFRVDPRRCSLDSACLAFELPAAAG
jgi:hypothetical protein